MFRVLACIKDQHDLRLVALALLVCVAGSWVGIKAYVQALRADEGWSRHGWILMSGIAVSAAEWTTHFLSMLAYKPGLQAAWDLPTSLASLAVAFFTAVAGLMLACRRGLPLAPETGGVVLGLGLAAMHFTGVQAYEVSGHIDWDWTYVRASIVLAIVFCVLALNRPSRPVTRFCRYGGVTALVLGICSLHFTAMAAATLVSDPSVVISSAAVADGPLALAVAAVALLLIGSCLLSYLLERRHSATAALRMSNLANATTEGMIIARNGRITAVNDHVLAWTGLPLEFLKGTEPAALWQRRSADTRNTTPDSFETDITSASGDPIPVQVITSTMVRGESIYAIRDLRSKRANEAQIRYMAHHDALTDLMNRATFAAAIDESIMQGAPFAILFIDLDRFKNTNDSQGHSIGDAVLIEVARRARRALPDALCARLGGDEFAVLKRLGSVDEADSADDLARILGEPFHHDGRIIRISASIGVAIWPTDGTDGDTILAAADMAMYQAKREGVGLTKRFDAALNEVARRRRQLSDDLITAVETAGIEVHYQVQTDVASGATLGFEALARWRHPVLGVIAPGEFVTLAEENGFIHRLGTLVMERACRDATTWPAPMSVAVNLSPAQFSEDVVAMIRRALDVSGLDPRRLEIEITESLLIGDPDRVVRVLEEIKAIGVSIAMDDFGTGYSSLRTLQSFPFDKIKIDRSFVDKLDENPQAQAIVRAVIGLGRSLDIPVLAEGVEREEDLQFLREQGCSGVQGYLVGRPVPLAGTKDHLPATHGAAQPEAA